MINNKGQSLLEVIVALAIFALISATMVMLSTGGFITLDVGGQQTEAQTLSQEGVEAVRAIRDRAWNELTFTTSSISTSSGQWIFDGEDTVSQHNIYTRTISVLPVCRDENNSIAPCPAFYTDVQTKKVISKVDWPVRNTTNTVQQITYLSNWDSLNWMQTDWSGGNGQNIWSGVNKYFVSDNIDASSTGQLQLKYTNDGGCGTKTWNFDNQYQYIFDSTNIEVISGLGQLKDLGYCSGSTSTCATLFNQTSCQVEQECSWTSNYSNAKPTIRNNNSYSPNQINYWSGFNASSSLNGGEIYYQLSNDDGVNWKYWNGTVWATSTANNDYNTSTIINDNITTFPTSSKKIMFKATLSGDGTQQVNLDQVQIGCSLTNDSDFIAPANYNYNTSTIEVTSSLAQLINLGGIYTTTSPSINPSISLVVPTTTFSSWTHFVETASKNGGEIYYQLSNDDGANWKYWNGTVWATSTANNDYNTSTIINDNITTFPTSTGKLMFKGFLKSNGTQLVQLDNVKVWWQEITGVSGYATLGSLISSAFNLADSSPVTLISWLQNTSTCNNCGVKFQVRTALNKNASPGVWSDWYGLNGVGDYFTDYRGVLIPKVLNWNQWVQYQVWLNGDGNSTPVLNGITIYYK